jgi:hypothetical protein
MHSLKPLALVPVVGMVAFALLAPIADAGASRPESTVKAAKKSCKKAKRSDAQRSAETARKRKKKCVVLRRTYRGKTSQGEPITLKTNNLKKKVYELGTYVQRVCHNYGSSITVSDQFEMLFAVRLRGTAFTAPLPSFDAEYLAKGTVTGHAGASTASGQANIPAAGEGENTCDAVTFSFSIPKVREVRGRRPVRGR